MPYQIFKITRPPEEPPLTRIELGKLISSSRRNVEWEVMEIMENWRSKMPCYGCKYLIHETWWDPPDCAYTGEPPWPCDTEDKEPEWDDGLEPGKGPLR